MLRVHRPHDLGRVLSLTCVGAALLSPPARSQDGPYTLRTVVLSGDPTPGVQGERFSRFFLNPSIDQSGRVAFYADILGRQICVDGTGIWSERTGSLALVAVEGQPAPGTPGVFRDLCGASSFFPLNMSIDSSGFAAFTARLDSPDLQDCNLNGIFENDGAQYTDRGGSLHLVVRKGDHAPEMPADIVFDQLPAVTIAPSGDLGATYILYAHTCPDFGDAPQTTYWDEGSGLHTVVQPGDPAPIPEMTFKLYGTCPKYTNDSGVLAYNNAIDGPGVGPTNDLVFVFDDHGTRRVKIREGQIAPGVEPGLRIEFGFGCSGFDGGLASVRGDVHAFRTRLLDADTLEERNAAALYVSRADDALVFITRRDDHAPGIPGALYADLGLRFPAVRPLPVADLGQVAFHAIVKGGGIGIDSNETIYDFDGEGLIQLVAREGAPIPGRAGVAFAQDIFPDATFGPAAMNRQGDFAFVAHLQGPGLNPFESNGLFFFDANSGALHTLLMTGDTIDVASASSDLRTIRKIDSFNNDFNSLTANGKAINDDDTVVLTLLFQDDTSGVFTVRFTIDGDGDSVRDTNDNCPAESNFGQQDGDGDGRGDICDCAPSDPGALSVPREVEDVRFYQDKETLAWRASRMAAGAGTTYQVFREEAVSVPVGHGGDPVCLRTGLTDETATDEALPPAGHGFRYLVRGVNPCGGSWGADSSDEPRSIAVCP